eukprot:TRINITY_DN25733_c0_g1_i1.p1 TRINITY_DN25733_c0_g1~~TRINITY_DN25733_c0_g1_i1.p1  ORF type:complete len:355 (+),score=58.42 TRINITY_DN25733_c0_g1_i1:34-1065(+)
MARHSLAKRGAVATVALLLIRGAVVPRPSAAAIPTSPCHQVSSRRCLLRTAGLSLTSGLSAPFAHAASIATPFGFSIDTGLLDPRAPPDVAGPPADAEVTASGLASKILLRPTCALSSSKPLDNPDCERANPYDKVLITYVGWTPDGRMFDSSQNEKRVIRVNSIMEGLTEGLVKMAPGETRRFWVPANLAFDNKQDPKKPSGPLVFDIELFAIERQPRPPDSLKAPPADALVTDSGLAYKVLKSGSGTQRPTADTNVTALYNGWSKNGDLVLSTSFGAQETFLVKEVPIPGLLEGLQLMVAGETRRFWIPAKLAFGEKPEGRNLPAGMLTFDMRLMSINAAS